MSADSRSVSKYVVLIGGSLTVYYLMILSMSVALRIADPIGKPWSLVVSFCAGFVMLILGSRTFWSLVERLSDEH